MADYSRHLTCIPSGTSHDLVMAEAREWMRRPFVSHQFTPLESRVLEKFFTNLDKRVFFSHSLPGNVTATIVSMYSRMKNPRGLRGVFVDTFLPGILLAAASLLDEFDGNVEKCLAHYDIKRLEDLQRLLSTTSENAELIHAFIANAGLSPEWLEILADSAKAKKFLEMWLDKYGHNSIARMGSVVFCCEDISVLAAKSLEWTRPGVGHVELSTRYVNMEKAGIYPISNECALLGGVMQEIEDYLVFCFDTYKRLEGGASLTGALPTFLRSKYSSLFGSAKQMDMGVFGETCDLLGNILPASVLTSVGTVVSGESFPGNIKHLLLDNKPETIALAELIAEESAKVGANQFLRHEQPNDWDDYWWKYLPVAGYMRAQKSPGILIEWDHRFSPPQQFVKRTLNGVTLEELGRTLAVRSEYDKLPAQFENIVAAFEGLISFRSWRDLHRQGFSTHHRTLLTPYLGFYQYDKTPLPAEVVQGFAVVEQRGRELYTRLIDTVPAEILEYILPLGFRVGCQYGANIRQHEFCIWQRTKASVNHEVRQFFLGIDALLEQADPDWRRISRTNRTQAFVFARGEEIPLPVNV